LKTSNRSARSAQPEMAAQPDLRLESQPESVVQALVDQVVVQITEEIDKSWLYVRFVAQSN
jgi:hypothetical protein